MTVAEKRIVIIGGSFAGIIAAKTIFNQNEQAVRVTLISTSTHSFFNIAAPRLLTEPDKAENTIFPIKETLEKYSNGTQFEFIHGKVESADLDKNSLIVDNSDGKQSINYDYLVIASGSRTDSAAFKLYDGHTETVAAIKLMNKSIIDAKKIIILGGGPTGVESAGELGYQYGKEKEIILYTGLKGPLAALGESRSKTSAEKLAALGVKVINDKASHSLESDNTQAKVIFDDGSSEVADLVIPAYGLTPNSEFLDKKFLDTKGFLKTDEFLRVEGYNNVLGFGDIVSMGERSFVDIMYAQKSTFEATVSHEFFGADLKLKSYSRLKPTLLVPISQEGGVGVAFGWNVPNFLVKFLKSKDFMIPNAGKDLA